MLLAIESDLHHVQNGTLVRHHVDVASGVEVAGAAGRFGVRLQFLDATVCRRAGRVDALGGLEVLLAGGQRFRWCYARHAVGASAAMDA